jgi:hypothetical protein
MATGLNVSKVDAYAVSAPLDLAVSKTLAYTVSAPTDLAISKVLAYAVVTREPGNEMR